MPIVDLRVCNEPEVMNGQVLPGMICAGHIEGGADACQGDSGGPLVVRNERENRFYLFGVVSWGIGCAERNKLGVYTDIYFYYDWIRNHIL